MYKTIFMLHEIIDKTSDYISNMTKDYHNMSLSKYGCMQ